MDQSQKVLSHMRLQQHLSQRELIDVFEKQIKVLNSKLDAQTTASAIWRAWETLRTNDEKRRFETQLREQKREFDEKLTQLKANSNENLKQRQETDEIEKQERLKQINKLRSRIHDLEEA